MDDKNEGAHHSETGKRQSISSRLDRLETEISQLLVLGAKKAARSDKSDATKLKAKRSNMISIESVFRNGQMNEISEEDEDTEEAMTVRHVNANGQSRYVLNNMLPADGESRDAKKRHKRAKDKLRKKRSVCKCQRTKCSLTRRRSKSADPKHFAPTTSTSGTTSDEERAARAGRATTTATTTRSCPTSAHDLRELRAIVTDLHQSNALAKTISETWQEKFLDLQKRCDSLKALQEQTIAQRVILGAACEKRATGAGTDEALADVCEDLRRELRASEERLQGLQQTRDSGGRMERRVLEQFESREELLISQANAKTEAFKKQIKEHLGEIEELRLTCAKNAEWACEESSLKSKLLQENKFLHKKLSQNVEKEQKHLDQINVLRRALAKIGKNDPRVMKLLQTLEKYEWKVGGGASKDLPMVTVGVHLTEVNDRSNSTALAPADAKRLIEELNAVISVQRKRIQELIDLTSTLIAVDEPDARMAPSREQVREDVEEVRGRYVALAATIKNLKVAAKRNKHELAEETKSRTTFEKQVSLLTEQLDESRGTVVAHLKTIAVRNGEIVAKDEEISKLRSEIVELKREKDALNKTTKAWNEQAHAFKQSFDRLRLDNMRQETIINNLDKKFELQRQEQFFQKLAIANEKERATRAAEFATNKLLETMEEYHSQNESQSNIRQALTRMLREKDERLRWTIDKVSGMSLDSRQIVDALKSLRPTTTAFEVSHTRDQHECDEPDMFPDAPTDEISEYETPQLYTLHEEEDEDDEEDKNRRRPT